MRLGLGFWDGHRRAPLEVAITSVDSVAYVGAETTVSGTCTPGQTVVVTIGGEPFGSTSDTASGAWSVTATCPNVEGDDVAVVATVGSATATSSIDYVITVQTEAWIAGLGEATTNGATVADIDGLGETNVSVQIDGDVEATGVGTLARLLYDTSSGLLNADFSVSYYAEAGTLSWVFLRVDNAGVYFNATTGEFGSDTSGGLITNTKSTQNGGGWDVELEYSGIPSSGVIRIFLSDVDAGQTSPTVAATAGDTLMNLKDLVVTQLRVGAWTGQISSSAATQAVLADMPAVGDDGHPFLIGDGDVRLVNTTLGPTYGNGITDFFAYVVFDHTTADTQGLFSFGRQDVSSEVNLRIASTTLDAYFNDDVDTIGSTLSIGSHVAVIQITGGSGYIYLDDDAGTSAVLSGPIDLAAFDLILHNIRLDLGHFCKIHEMGFGTTLTTTQKSRLFAAMVAKWGLS